LARRRSAHLLPQFSPSTNGLPRLVPFHTPFSSPSRLRRQEFPIRLALMKPCGFQLKDFLVFTVLLSCSPFHHTLCSLFMFTSSDRHVESVQSTLDVILRVFFALSHSSPGFPSPHPDRYAVSLPLCLTVPLNLLPCPFGLSSFGCNLVLFYVSDVDAEFARSRRNGGGSFFWCISSGESPPFHRS